MIEVVPGQRDFPMASATRLRSRDLALVERTIGELVEPRHFRACDRGGALDIRISHVPLGFGHLFGVRHGAAVRVTSGPIRSCQVMIPIRGRLVGRNRGTEVIADPGAAIAYSPNDRLDTYWSSDCVAIVLSLCADRLSSLARQRFPNLACGDLAFAPRLSLTEGSGRSFANVLGTICEESVDDRSAYRRGLTTRALEEAFALSLLATQDAAAIPAAVARFSRPAVRLATIERALDFIERHCAGGIGVADLSTAAGVSPRTLQYAFIDHFGVGPMTFVRQVRLRKVHAILEAACPGQCAVGDVAATWGFYNGSAFAKAYRRQFGELPSATLNRN